MLCSHEEEVLSDGVSRLSCFIWGLIPPERSDSAKVKAILNSYNVDSPNVDPINTPSGIKESKNL